MNPRISSANKPSWGQFNSRHNHSTSFSQLVDSCDIVTWKLNLKWSRAQKVWNSHSTVVHTLKLKIPAGWTNMPHLNQLTVHMPEKLPVYSLHGLWTILGLITTQFDWGLKKTSVVLCLRLYLTFQRAHDLPNYRAFFFPGGFSTTCRTWAGESVSSTLFVFCVLRLPTQVPNRLHLLFHLV